MSILYLLPLQDASTKQQAACFMLGTSVSRMNVSRLLYLQQQQVFLPSYEDKKLENNTFSTTILAYMYVELAQILLQRGRV